MVRVVLLPVAIASLTGMAAAASSDELAIDVATLRAKIAAASGPPPPASVEVRTARERGATTARVTTTYRRGADVRNVAGDGPFHTESGVAGGEHWHQDANGITVEEPPLEEPDAPAPLVTVSRVRTPLDAYCITTDDRRGTVTREYVDPSTFLVERRDVAAPWGMVSTTYRDFAKIGEQTLPTAWTIDDRHAVTVTDVTRTLDVQRPVTAADVAEPATRRVLIDPLPGPVELPVTFVGGKPIVHATIDGRPADLLLDSGSSSIVLDTTFARSIGLTPTNRRMNPNNAQLAEYFDATVSTLGAGAVTMHDVRIAVTALPALDGHAAGLLGFDFFASACVTIDYARKAVVVTPYETWHPPTGAGTLALDVKLGNQTPQTVVTVEGHRGDRFTLDTGAAGTFLIFSSFAERYPHIGSFEGGGYIIGAGGSTPVERMRFHEIDLGPKARFLDYDGDVTTSPASYAATGDGSIGEAFLNLFTVDFDYVDGRVYLTPNDNARRAGMRSR